MSAGIVHAAPYKLGTHPLFGANSLYKGDEFIAGARSHIGEGIWSASGAYSCYVDTHPHGSNHYAASGDQDFPLRKGLTIRRDGYLSSLGVDYAATTRARTHAYELKLEGYDEEVLRVLVLAELETMAAKLKADLKELAGAAK